MYSADLSTFSVADFVAVLRSVELLPSRRFLLDTIDGVVSRLQQRGVTNLEELRRLLKKKTDYPLLAEELATTVDFLTVVSRDIEW